MLPNPRHDRAPVAGNNRGAKGAGFDGLPANDSALSREQAWPLLLHACDVLACAAAVMLGDGRISYAGREVILYTAIRLRELREVLS